MTMPNYDEDLVLTYTLPDPLICVDGAAFIFPNSPTKTG